MNWDEPSTPEKKQRIGPAQIGTALFMVLTVLVAVCYVTVFVNPQMPFNPFKPLLVQLPTPTAVAGIPGVSGTPTPIPTLTVRPTFPPTWTPTLTPTPTNTFTPRPTSTPKPPTSTPKPLPAFSLRWDPVYTSQTLYPGAEGWWTGVAGEVSDRNNVPVTNVKIRVWDDFGHTWEVTPGDASRYADTYGSSYGGGGTFAWWEQVLDASCHQSVDVHVQVIRNGHPASGTVTVKTKSDCAQNLVLIHWRKNY